jgi:hypothetical protein
MLDTTECSAISLSERPMVVTPTIVPRVIELCPSRGYPKDPS